MRRNTSIYEVDSRNLSSPLWFGLAIKRLENLKNVDCWSAHCYALADGKIVANDKMVVINSE